MLVIQIILKKTYKHNSKGAKSTKGYKWVLIYKKNFIKNKACHLNIT